MKLSNRMIPGGRALAVAMLFMVASPLFAMTASQSESAGEMSEEKLKAVANAYIKVFEIQKTYGPQIETAQTPEEANQLQQAANQKMVEVIENEENVTLDEYNDVISEIGNDEELRTRLQTHVDEILEEESE